MQATVERLPASFNRTYKNSSDDNKSRSHWFTQYRNIAGLYKHKLEYAIFQLGVYKLKFPNNYLW
ncbi:hypothetical protein BPLS_P0112 [Bathymodiolus platifrons methanotrophic gill symbiont]|uniref:hypothetical protein n=1 Tax=Bathymodiolus platifrons methanotrophic gill symbiont TaxID=113268 RepID=UPI000B415240|nr:hypothetical protein [Bathymodiolus platifrons methanotrophic gill symbiont]MCK5870930.1 hypothetical protein [Methyloprofundus sp.]TXK96984.1 hypothetical protein BMR10_06515 [Methylococcaceae bacterium CS4]TXK98351.1 hypothetical protein BMR11_08680 [Methylococcaceae bacterium CS5]TXL04485.1 hypothetical protein BMR09_12340 [Methylococcaceae bacterium CS3]TXL05992.1 hypothetical protein BMR07_08440 [Methylococcaceae bacterium CS1]TXL10558.1 hypothetical protein BMR08_08715 [Methylococcac